jgi:hypothetical protein
MGSAGVATKAPAGEEAVEEGDMNKSSSSGSSSLILEKALPPVRVRGAEQDQAADMLAGAAAGQVGQRQQQQQLMEEGFLGGDHLHDRHHHNHDHQKMGWHHMLQQPFLFSLACTMPRVSRGGVGAAGNGA